MKFDVSNEATDLIVRIVGRAVDLQLIDNLDSERRRLLMDLTVVPRQRLPARIGADAARRA